MNSGTGLEIGADFFLDLGSKINDLHGRDGKWRTVLYRNDIITQIQITAGAGTLDNPAQLEPVRGQVWDVRRLTAWGFSAGNVQAQINAQEPIANWAAAGPMFFGKAEVLLQPGDRLTFTAAGITGSVYLGIAPTIMPYEYLTEYLS